MHSTTVAFEKSMVFHGIRCLNILVPIRFENHDMEKAFNDYLRQDCDHFALVLATFVAASVAHFVGNWEDMALIIRGKGEPWNYFLACAAVLAVLFHIACLGGHCVRAKFFTAKRRLLFFILTLTLYALCNRPFALAIYRVDWPYVATTQINPPITWIVMSSMILCSVSCQSWCLQSKYSWIMCTYTSVVVFVADFVLPSGPEVVQQCLLLTSLFIVQIIVCFIGQVNIETAERRTFLHIRNSEDALVEERAKRCEAETRTRRAELRQPENETMNQVASGLGQQTYVNPSPLSELLFRGLHRASSDDLEAMTILVQELEQLGEQEHWLIQPEDLTLHPARILGFGGFGSVVAGTWMSGEVAVKVPKARKPDENHPLALEIRHLRKLRHPCIVSFLGICIAHDFDILLVEELVVGDNLKVFMSKLGSFANQCSHYRQNLLLDVSAALHYLHSQGPAIVHGDLKPENIIVDRHWVSKLTDFGLARRSSTRDKMPGGTPKWLESRLRTASRSSGVHESVDIWALGGITFFVCAGVGPWEGKSIRGSPSMEAFSSTIFELWQGEGDLDEEDATSSPQHKQRFHADPEELNCLSALCCKCMSPDPYQRPSARDVHQEVLSWRNISGVRRKNTEGTHGDAQPVDRNDSLSDKRILSEQLAAVRIRLANRVSHGKGWTRQVELPANVLNEIKGVLCQQCACLRRLLHPGSHDHPDSHDHQSLYIMQMLLASVFQENSLCKTGISL
eukprot:TRINITY_DN4818_c0_g1_i6.p1 TRINITY_DN4818_c0_g1~~TRINITY_DN4818_c0_g1_i6.p1  ORF type:complete len:738 (-),score=44.05 TRINITY_DN4818_c0_g1_i6:219-2432(-)